MKGLGLDFDLDGLLFSLVYKYQRTIREDRDDLMSEARIAAWVAIQTYDEKKKAKLSSYIYRCVENRLRNIHEAQKSKPHLIYEYDPPDSPFESYKDVEFDMVMRKVLTEKEYVLYYDHYVMDLPITQILNQRKIFKDFKEIKSCLHRISQKYLLLETNQIKILTQKRLQEKWVGDSLA